MSADPRLDRLLTEAAEAAPSPRSEGEEATVAAVLLRRRRRAALPVWLAAAAVLLLGLGLGLGYWWGRDGSAPAREPLEQDWAGRERRVFEEARTALGEDLAWLASAGGEITLALRPGEEDPDLRVVAFELRDETGRTVSRPRVVLPDGREAEVRLAGIPRVLLRATAAGPGTVEVTCRLEFDDGATLAAGPHALSGGGVERLGEVFTRGRTLALYAAAD